MKSNIKRKQSEQDIAKFINQERLISIAKGFQGMAKEIIKKIDEGADIKEIRETCEWYVNNSDNACKTSN